MTNFTIQENEAQYNKQIQEFLNALCDELGRILILIGEIWRKFTWMMSLGMEILLRYRSKGY